MDGTLINQRYRIHSKIKEGGMAFVFLCFDERLSRWVALKMLKQEFLRDNELTLRFRQEAILAAKINHPNIVTIFDVGTTPENGIFIVSELIEGWNLYDLSQGSTLKLSTRFPVDVYLCILFEALVGLEVAHQAGIIHRDLKPENILISTKGEVKLVDFGIAKNVRFNQTTKGQFIGSPSYSSPEQVSQAVLMPSSDIFVLGILIYECYTLALPFSGSTPLEVLSKIQKATYNSVPLQSAKTPSLAELIIKRCLNRSPQLRYQQVRELLLDLSRLLSEVYHITDTKKCISQFLQTLPKSQFQKENLTQRTPKSTHTPKEATNVELKSDQGPSNEGTIITDKHPDQRRKEAPKPQKVNVAKANPKASDRPRPDPTSSFSKGPYILLGLAVVGFLILLFQRSPFWDASRWRVPRESKARVLPKTTQEARLSAGSTQRTPLRPSTPMAIKSAVPNSAKSDGAPPNHWKAHESQAQSSQTILASPEVTPVVQMSGSLSTPQAAEPQPRLKKTGSLSFSTPVPVGQIWINGVAQEGILEGDAFQRELPKGLHVVRITPKTDEFLTFERKVLIDPGKETQLGLVNLVFTRKINIKTKNNDLLVRVNGDPYSLRGKEVSVTVPEGETVIEARNKAGAAFYKVVSVKNEDVNIRINLP